MIEILEENGSQSVAIPMLKSFSKRIATAQSTDDLSDDPQF